MRKINKPEFRIKKVLKDNISNMQDQALKDELNDSAEIFSKSEKEFENLAVANELHKIKRDKTISDTIDADILKKLYTGRMLQKNNPSRKYYDKIFIGAPGGKCPYCSHRIVRTLDHYLPKANYPILSIIPLNLVPSCTDCNKDKLINYPHNREEETLHPYFDDVEDLNFLKTRIISLKPIVFQFFISPPVETEILLKKRLRNHFTSYKLNDLYCSHASEEFENIKFQLTDVFNSGGYNSLKDHLIDSYNSRKKNNINSWQSAFYECLSTNEDFLNGAFIETA